MVHFYESSMITTKDGLQCQVYSNQHPKKGIIVKPKYIPTKKISSDSLPYRFILGKKVNRLDMWTDAKELKKYIEKFARVYPDYVFESDIHDRSPLFFVVPHEKIEKIYSPREGLRELMSIPYMDLDDHLEKVVGFVKFLLQSGLKLHDFGITYSTLMGYYSRNMSDINIVIYGKNKFWKLMDFLEKNKHKDLRWKNYEEWEKFYNKRNRNIVHDKEIYIKNMHRKRTEGFFKDTLFVLFALEEPEEAWFKWGEERYKRIGFAKFNAKIKSNYDSIVRPGCYEVSNSKFLKERIKIASCPFSSINLFGYLNSNIFIPNFLLIIFIILTTNHKYVPFF